MNNSSVIKVASPSKGGNGASDKYNVGGGGEYSDDEMDSSRKYDDGQRFAQDSVDSPHSSVSLPRLRDSPKGGSSNRTSPSSTLGDAYQHTETVVPRLPRLPSVAQYEPSQVKPKTKLFGAVGLGFSRLLRRSAKVANLPSSAPDGMQDGRGGPLAERTGKLQTAPQVSEVPAENDLRPPAPEPPKLLSRAEDRLTLSWPDPIDDMEQSQIVEERIVTQYHLQFQSRKSDPVWTTASDKIRRNRFVHSFDYHSNEPLGPGSEYRFRLRFRNHYGWGPFSDPTEWFRTVESVRGPEREGEFDNGRYCGGWWKGKPHGFGTWSHPTFGTYKGGYMAGFPHGEGEWISPNKNERYKGQMRYGKRHGRGVYYYADGFEYDGQWKYGLKSGQGVWTYPNGEVYKGHFLEDHPDGYGVHTWPDKCKYVGEWKRGKMDGEGVYSWPSGEEYTGLFSNGRPVPGQGVKSFSSQHKSNGAAEAHPERRPDSPPKPNLNAEPVNARSAVEVDEPLLSPSAVRRSGSSSSQMNVMRAEPMRPIRSDSRILTTPPDAESHSKTPTRSWRLETDPVPEKPVERETRLSSATPRDGPSEKSVVVNAKPQLWEESAKASLSHRTEAAVSKAQVECPTLIVPPGPEMSRVSDDLELSISNATDSDASSEGSHASDEKEKSPVVVSRPPASKPTTSSSVTPPRRSGGEEEVAELTIEALKQHAHALHERKSKLDTEYSQARTSKDKAWVLAQHKRTFMTGLQSIIDSKKSQKPAKEKSAPRGEKYSARGERSSDNGVLLSARRKDDDVDASAADGLVMRGSADLEATPSSYAQLDAIRKARIGLEKSLSSAATFEEKAQVLQAHKKQLREEMSSKNPRGKSAKGFELLSKLKGKRSLHNL